jgi:hypothetical protein
MTYGKLLSRLLWDVPIPSETFPALGSDKPQFCPCPTTRLCGGIAVLWEVVEGPKEWIGTKISWELKQEDSFSIVMFKHQGWKEPVEFMHHCSTKWAIFLMSLKSLVETGKGAPSPHDTKISNWH